MDDHGRRNQLRFRGIAEAPRENWQQCQEKVARLLREVMGGVPAIERAHRVGAMNINYTREIIVKFLRYPDKEEILSKRKQFLTKGVTIREDFSSETFALRASYHDQVKEARKKGKVAYVKYRKVVSHYPRNRSNTGTDTHRATGGNREPLGGVPQSATAQPRDTSPNAPHGAARGQAVPGHTDFSVPPPPLPTQHRTSTVLALGPASPVSARQSTPAHGSSAQESSVNMSSITNPITQEEVTER